MIETYFMDCRQLQIEENYQTAYDLVSPYRRQKIALLKHQKDKNRSLAAALTLHQALAKYALEERMMEYDIGKNGKPYFRYYPQYSFSLSHSGDYAICSMGQTPVGNDIERIKSGRLKVAERFFAKEENIWIGKALSEAEKEKRMFRLWTMKESFLKVTGYGMALDLKDFVVTVSEENMIYVNQKINANSYAMKEYRLPAEDGAAYCVSVCSESDTFAKAMQEVQIEDILKHFRERKSIAVE